MAEPPANADTPTVRVIVVNYNAGAHLKRCLEALRNQTMANFEAVIVDNASTDGSLLDAIPDDPKFRLIQLEDNTGFAAANNLGAKDCKTPWLATLNPDAFAEPGWLENLLAATKRYPNTAMFGSTQIDASDPEKLDGTGDCYFAFGLAWRGNHGHPIGDLPEDGETFSPCAAAAMYKTSAFHDAGGFDERFFCYLEDVDLGFRLRLRGEHCIQVKNAVVHHVGSALTGPKSDFVRFHSARNNVWLFVKNMPGILFWLLLPGHVVLQVTWLIWATIRGHLPPIWRGIFASFKEWRAIWQDRKINQSTRSTVLREILTTLSFKPWLALRKMNTVRMEKDRFKISC